MRKPLILAGAVALGGASLLIPSALAGQASPLTAEILIDCTTTAGAANHSYTVVLTNNTDVDIDMTSDPATLTINGGTPGPIETGNDPVVDGGGTYTYPTVIPVDPDGDESITAVFNATYEGEGDVPITVTATAEPCESTPTTEAPTPTTTTPPPAAVESEVDFTG